MCVWCVCVCAVVVCVCVYVCVCVCACARRSVQRSEFFDRNLGDFFFVKNSNRRNPSRVNNFEPQTFADLLF
jgi:hypothetical protein